jgi:hypothetical protein
MTRHTKQKFTQTEDELDIYDIWQSSNGNLFIKLNAEYSIAIGQFGEHKPNACDLEGPQFVRTSNSPARRVGKLKFKKGFKG